MREEISAKMTEFHKELYTLINDLEGWVFVGFTYEWTQDVCGILEEMATLRAEVRSIVEIQVMVISLVISSFTQLLPQYRLTQFDLFVVEDSILVVGTKRGRDEELQDPTISYD